MLVTRVHHEGKRSGLLCLYEDRTRAVLGVGLFAMSLEQRLCVYLAALRRLCHTVYAPSPELDCEYTAGGWESCSYQWGDDDHHRSPC